MDLETDFSGEDGLSGESFDVFLVEVESGSQGLGLAGVGEVVLRRNVGDYCSLRGETLELDFAETWG